MSARGCPTCCCCCCCGVSGRGAVGGGAVGRRAARPGVPEERGRESGLALLQGAPGAPCTKGAPSGGARRGLLRAGSPGGTWATLRELALDPLSLDGPRGRGVTPYPELGTWQPGSRCPPQLAQMFSGPVVRAESFPKSEIGYGLKKVGPKLRPALPSLVLLSTSGRTGSPRSLVPRRRQSVRERKQIHTTLADFLLKSRCPAQ